MNYVREIVSGQKNRLKDGVYNLDLTYVCPRVIAMSFPACGVEITYRNDIDDVSSFLKERHNDECLIYNCSNRQYNYQKFFNKVLEYKWEDHHSPPIHMLFDICYSISLHLKG